MLSLAGIGLATIVCQWFAWWVKLPAILFLLLTGLLAGPVLGVLNPDELFGELLFPVISLSVAIILFEGALTLRSDQIRGLETVVRRLLSTGILVTWAITSIACHYLVGLAWPLSILFGALVVVTGPTVIVPMLRTVRPNQRISNILRWEGIAIDPIGALLAVLVFEFIIASGTDRPLGHALLIFGEILLVGGFLGALFGYGFGLILRHHLMPEYLHNTAALALVCGSYTLSDSLVTESGLLTVTIMGMWLANMPKVDVDDILDFKESLSIVLISALFILLAARIDVATVKQLGWAGLGVFLCIQLVARPLKVLVATIGTDLPWSERAMLAWIAPRGIVAAAVTALFALKLQNLGHEQAALLVPLTFSVIIGTVVLQSTTAGWLARRLGVAEPEPSGYLLVGANPVARSIAATLHQHQVPVILTSSNWGEIREARMAGLKTFYGKAVSKHADQHLDLVGIGHLLALEPHAHLNELAAMRYGREFGRNHVYLLPVRHDDDKHRHTRDQSDVGQILFEGKADYGTLARLLSQDASVSSTTLTEQFDKAAFLENLDKDAVVLFQISPSGKLSPVCDEISSKVGKGWKLLTLKPKRQEEATR